MPHIFSAKVNDIETLLQGCPAQDGLCDKTHFQYILPIMFLPGSLVNCAKSRVLHQRCSTRAIRTTPIQGPLGRRPDAGASMRRSVISCRRPQVELNTPPRRRGGRSGGVMAAAVRQCCGGTARRSARVVARGGHEEGRQNDEARITTRNRRGHQDYRFRDLTKISHLARGRKSTHTQWAVIDLTALG